MARGGIWPCLTLVVCKWHGEEQSIAAPLKGSSEGKWNGLAARCMIACACKSIFRCIGRPTPKDLSPGIHAKRKHFFFLDRCKEEALLP